MIFFDLVDDRPEWMAQAECRHSDSRLFYPQRGESTKPAKTICAACPVQAECLDYALARGEKHGIWGGTTVRDRRQILRQQRRTQKAA